MQQVRAFFNDKEVLEVETPLMGSSITCDPALDPVVTASDQLGQYYLLQSSPEFAMKRLLAKYKVPMYQVCKAFRKGEAGARHNPEFTMLEWYRPGYSMEQLMAEVWELVSGQLGLDDVETKTYRGLFQEYLDTDLISVSDNTLARTAWDKTGFSDPEADRDTLLNLLFSDCIEPHLTEAVFITDYPASQAALAQIEEDDQGYRIARRFELVVDGLELANGYLELTDAVEQERRFEEENRIRTSRGMSLYPIDEKLLQAMKAGLPACSGVALGLDRLLMLKTKASAISEVLAFPIADI